MWRQPVLVSAFPSTFQSGGPTFPCSRAGGFEDDDIAPAYKEHLPYPHTNKGSEMVPRAPAHLDVLDRRLRSSRAAGPSRPILALLAWGFPAWDTRRQRVHKCKHRLSLSLSLEATSILAHPNEDEKLTPAR
jgi:hypothetical protein